MEGPPLAQCIRYVEVLQGDPAVCSGTLGPTDKTRKLLDAYLRIPILEREKEGLASELVIERETNRKLAEAAEVEFWETPSFWIPVTVAGVLAGVLIGAVAVGN